MKRLRSWPSSSKAALPASVATGDLILAIIGSKNNVSHTSSSTGWVKIDQVNSGTGWTV